jgi:hypothetical protein
MFIPGIRESPHGFTQTHGQPRDGFEALDGGGRQAVAPREQQFRVSENSSQRIVHFVPQDFTEVAC